MRLVDNISNKWYVKKSLRTAALYHRSVDNIQYAAMVDRYNLLDKKVLQAELGYSFDSV
jgi:hypothetical protein